MSHEQPHSVIVGPGTDGGAHMAPEVGSWVKANNVSLLVHPSYDAAAKISEFAERKKRTAALIRRTC